MENLSISVIMAMGCYIVAILGLLFFSYFFISRLYNVLKDLKDYKRWLRNQIDSKTSILKLSRDSQIEQEAREGVVLTIITLSIGSIGSVGLLTLLVIIPFVSKNFFNVWLIIFFVYNTTHLQKGANFAPFLLFEKSLKKVLHF